MNIFKSLVTKSFEFHCFSGRYYLKVGSMEYDSGKGMQTAEEIKKWFLSKDEKPGEKETLSKPLFEALPGTTL